MKGSALERALKFARAYFVDPHGVRAAKAAGFGGNAAALAVRASEQLKLPAVQGELEKLRTAARASAVMERRECEEILAAVARFDYRALLNAGGTYFDLPAAAKFGALKMIEKLSIKEDGTSVAIPSRLQALRQLAELNGWNAAEKVEHSFSGLSEEQLNAEIARELKAVGKKEPCESRRPGGKS